MHVCANKAVNENREWKIKEPKSYAGDRYIIFPDFVARKWRDIKGPIVQLTPDMITNRFERLVKRAGVPHFRFHDLRHYSTSVQHTLGVRDAYLIQRSGWSSDAVLKSVYRHAMADKTDDMSDLANRYFEGLFGEDL